ncbi:hypothetical protein BOTBODRAFT_494683 [Botryobasidium botryosum FD-172 SS1]|uniref:Uncharacterized protein n=1 Tax=Botryobasidium botryosum (strain FD-172 SS1) TaxID=930990 RepID=A0A067M3N8_BOTB1|nr:hypothetical protein BOTBODRAFT_494683 [Botryobasidium botryosum FD-172 SS1]
MNEDVINFFVGKQTEERFIESVTVVKQVNARLHRAPSPRLSTLRLALYSPVSEFTDTLLFLGDKFHGMRTGLMETMIHLVRNHVSAKATCSAKATEQKEQLVVTFIHPLVGEYAGYSILLLGPNNPIVYK